MCQTSNDKHIKLAMDRRQMRGKCQALHFYSQVAISNALKSPLERYIPATQVQNEVVWPELYRVTADAPLCWLVLGLLSQFSWISTDFIGFLIVKSFSYDVY